MLDWSQIREKHIVYEDEKIIGINKPNGITVSNDRNKLDLVTLAKDSNEIIYPVHRIDKETSGLVLFAKDIKTHGHLTQQFAKRSVEKNYISIVSGRLQKSGLIDLPLSVGRKNKVRIAAQREDIFMDNNVWRVPENKIFQHVKSYPSQTKYLNITNDEKFSLLLLKPITGRTHQIRVHLAWINHPIIGDPLFAKKSDPIYERMFLHSFKLKFEAFWTDDIRMEITAQPHDSFWLLLQKNYISEIEKEILAKD